MALLVVAVILAAALVVCVAVEGGAVEAGVEAVVAVGVDHEEVHLYCHLFLSLKKSGMFCS